MGNWLVRKPQFISFPNKESLKYLPYLCVYGQPPNKEKLTNDLTPVVKLISNLQLIKQKCWNPYFYNWTLY